jgi:hypothetical protein
MDLKKIYIGQKTHDKMGLRYIEPLPSSVSKVTGSPKKMGAISKKIKNKSDNMQKKNIIKKYNYAYQYRYLNRRNRNNNYHQRNKDIFNP